ncbi:helix-turn-helix domain-containing protein [Bordetella sp. 2513F-2]
MREILECAVLSAPGRPAGLPSWGGSAATGSVPALPLRLHLDAFDLAIGAAGDEAGLIAAAALRLRRYDACLLPVEPATLPWVRMALSRAGSVLTTPVIALVREVRAPAMADLFELGVADFLPAPLCQEELRARMLRLLERRRASSGALQPTMPQAAPSWPSAASARLEALSEGSPGYGVGRGPASSGAEGAAGVAVPFREAKARVVAGFEREYLCRALERHGGNVARAARASSKHRRAFWALMRKHRIDAAPYRGQPQAPSPEP